MHSGRAASGGTPASGKAGQLSGLTGRQDDSADVDVAAKAAGLL